MAYWRDSIDRNDGTERDEAELDGKTVVKMEPWSRRVPSHRQFHLSLTCTIPSRRENISRCTLTSRPVQEIPPYRPVPSTKPAPTVPSRLQTISLPFLPAVNTRPCSPIQRPKPVPTISALPFFAVNACRQGAVTVKMPWIPSIYFSINGSNT